MSNDDAGLIGRREVKQLLHVKSDVTIWKYCKDGKLPMYRIGRRILFKESEILEAIRINAST